jgi:hypothetical protein
VPDNGVLLGGEHLGSTQAVCRTGSTRLRVSVTSGDHLRQGTDRPSYRGVARAVINEPKDERLLGARLHKFDAAAKLRRLRR